MLKITNLKIDIPSTVGSSMLLVEVRPRFEYQNGQRTDTITGYSYIAVLPDRSFEKLSVWIDGPQLMQRCSWTIYVSLRSLQRRSGARDGIGTPWGSWKIRDNLLRGGLYNHAGEAPILLSVDKPTNNGKRKKGSNSRMTVYEFDPVGIPLTVLGEKRDVIETALGIIIDQIKYGNGRKTILVSGVPATCDLPPVLPWKENYLSHEDFVLVLGESLSGPVTANLSNIPHILLGGSTGSGKSVLLKLLLMQSIQKGAEVYIADFKGGVDFAPVWHKKCRMCVTETDLLTVLEEIVTELERRKKCFVETGCANLSEYNKRTGNNLHHLVFAMDEVAELFDQNGRSKTEKELLAKISSLLATIARQGRSFGCHCLLATQRPDATVIPGQIKNNLDFRVCGRADNVLSQIVLDNTSAADQIPKDAQGRFITGDGTVFQAYFFDERKL